jgi:hypothetical protein
MTNSQQYIHIYIYLAFLEGEEGERGICRIMRSREQEERRRKKKKKKKKKEEEDDSGSAAAMACSQPLLRPS